MTERVEGSRSARSSEISRRVSGEDGCAAVGCGGGTVAGGILFISFFSFSAFVMLTSVAQYNIAAESENACGIIEWWGRGWGVGVVVVAEGGAVTACVCV